MDSVSLQRFNHILEKPLNLLTQDEVSFLKARRLALNPMQRKFYAEMFGDVIYEDEIESKEEVVEAEKPKRTVKKKVETN